MKKFVTISFAAGMALGLLFTSISFISSRKSDAKDAVLYFTTAQAKLISSNVKCALSFDDAEDANSVLDSLKSQYYIAYAGIYDCQGNLFSSYCRQGHAHETFKLPPYSKTRFKYTDGYLIVSEPIIHENEYLGTVCLWAQI